MKNNLPLWAGLMFIPGIKGLPLPGRSARRFNYRENALVETRPVVEKYYLVNANGRERTPIKVIKSL